MSTEAKPAMSIEEFVAAAKSWVVTPAEHEMFLQALRETEAKLQQEAQEQYAGQAFMNRVYSI